MTLNRPYLFVPERAKSLMKIASESDVPFTYTIGTKDTGTFYKEVYLKDAKFTEAVPRDEEDIAAILTLLAPQENPKVQ